MTLDRSNDIQDSDSACFERNRTSIRMAGHRRSLKVAGPAHLEALSEMKTNSLSLWMLCLLAEFAVAAEPITLKLWPDGPPTAMVPKSEATAKLMDPAATPRHQRLDLHLLERGIATMRGEALCFSAAHSEADVDQTVAALESAMVALIEEGGLGR